MWRGKVLEHLKHRRMNVRQQVRRKIVFACMLVLAYCCFMVDVVNLWRYVYQSSSRKTHTTSPSVFNVHEMCSCILRTLFVINLRLKVLSELVEAAQALPDDEALHESVIQVCVVDVYVCLSACSGALAFRTGSRSGSARSRSPRETILCLLLEILNGFSS